MQAGTQYPFLLHPVKQGKAAACLRPVSPFPEIPSDQAAEEILPGQPLPQIQLYDIMHTDIEEDLPRLFHAAYIPVKKLAEHVPEPVERIDLYRILLRTLQVQVHD